MTKRIAIGADHAGFVLKEKLKAYLVEKGYRVKDVGTYSEESCDYPRYAAQVASEVSQKKYPLGLLICKTGIGNSIVANRFPGVRASLCYNVLAARLTREDNDSNILVLGSGFVDTRKARRICEVWLTTKFQGGRHQRRVNEITGIEKELACQKR